MKKTLMKKLKPAILIFALTFLFIGCDKEEHELQEPTATDIFSVPNIETAKSHFISNNNLSAKTSNTFARTSQTTFEVDWEHSVEALYKKESEENINILYTPTLNLSNEHTKTFIGSVEVDGSIESKIFTYFYNDSQDHLTFSGYMLVYDLDGNLESANKYLNGQQINVTNTTQTNRSMVAGRSSDCDFGTIGCLLDWLGGNLDDLASFFIQLDEVVVTAYIGNGGPISDGPSGWNSFDGALDPIESNGGQSGGGTYWSVPSWYNYNSVSPNAQAIAMTLDLHPLSAQADWLLNQADQETLNAIAQFLNQNRERDQTLDNTNPNDINENISNATDYSWVSDEAVDFINRIINHFINNPYSSYEIAQTLAELTLEVEIAQDNWTIDSGTYRNRPALVYTHTFRPDPLGKMYLLENGLILLESTKERVINIKDFENTIASTEVVLDNFHYIFNNDTNKWYEYRLPPASPLASADIDFLLDAFWDGAKFIGRYATPLEDAIILIDGVDFDGVEQDRVQTAGFMIVGFIPGGKAFKPVAKIVNGITKYRKIVKVTVNGIEKSTSLPIKIVNGVVEFGSSGSKLREVINLTDPTKHAHHIIPWAKRNLGMVQKAAKSDKAFHMNEALNGIPLLENLHFTGHPTYSNKIEDILVNNFDENMSPEDAINFIEGLTNHIRNLINNNQTLNSGQIANLISYP